MKITIEEEGQPIIIYQEVTDYYLAVRQLMPMSNKSFEMAVLPETKSYSKGNNLRELAKELYQSWIEIQKYLEKQCQLPLD